MVGGLQITRGGGDSTTQKGWWIWLVNGWWNEIKNENKQIKNAYK